MKILRIVYVAISYIMFFLLAFSLLLNATSVIAPAFTGESFNVDYWELMYIPFIIHFEVLNFRPRFPRFLMKGYNENLTESKEDNT